MVSRLQTREAPGMAVTFDPGICIHAGKSGTVRDINTSPGGNVTITVAKANGERFKTLARNVERQG